MNHALRTVTIVGLALCPLLAPSLAAADNNDRLGLSRDGVHFNTSLDRPLFGDEVRWVPGDVRTASFYARNQSTDGAALAVDLERPAREALLDTDFLAVSARADDGARVRLDQAGRHDLAEFGDSRPIAAGQQVEVTVRAAFSPQAPNATMKLATDLSFHVRLSDARAVGDASGTGGTGGNSGTGVDSADGGSGHDGLLPATGNTVTRGLLWLGLALTAAGGLLLGRRRRETDDDAVEVHRG